MSGSRALSVVVMTLSLVALTACGTSVDAGSPAPASRPPRPAVVSATAGSSAATSSTAAEARLLLTAADLPAGWRDSPGADGDYRTSVCGVDLEPVAAQSARSLRFSQGPIGPFLAQYLRSYADDQAGQVAARLAAALPACTTYTVEVAVGSGRATFTVERLVVPGLADGDVAWRQTSVGVAHPIIADYVLAVRGRSAVVLASYAITGPPDPQVLQVAYRALQARR